MVLMNKRSMWVRGLLNISCWLHSRVKCVCVWMWGSHWAWGVFSWSNYLLRAQTNKMVAFVNLGCYWNLNETITVRRTAFTIPLLETIYTKFFLKRIYLFLNLNTLTYTLAIIITIHNPVSSCPFLRINNL